jgi:hypothetical protein
VLKEQCASTHHQTRQGKATTPKKSMIRQIRLYVGGGHQGDFEAERNILHISVIPKLNDALAHRRITVTPYDMSEDPVFFFFFFFFFNK